MIWFYDAISGTRYLYDINGTHLCSYEGYFPFKVESKYRYSGLLYDKLRCLVSYKYINMHYLHPSLKPDNLFAITVRFHMTLMEFQYYTETLYENTIDIAGSPITVVTNRNLHFINN